MLFQAVLPDVAEVEDLPPRPPGWAGPWKVPIVTDWVWSSLVVSCRQPILTVEVRRRPSSLSLSRCQLLSQRRFASGLTMYMYTVYRRRYRTAFPRNFIEVSTECTCNKIVVFPSVLYSSHRMYFTRCQDQLGSWYRMSCTCSCTCTWALCFLTGSKCEPVQLGLISIPILHL